MIIKPSGITNYSINPFYLYGFNETGLAKAFAYILSKRNSNIHTRTIFPFVILFARRRHRILHTQSAKE
jgi:hypothetical protein